MMTETIRNKKYQNMRKLQAKHGPDFSLFSVLQWNIHGFNSNDDDITLDKEQALLAIDFDIQPDIVCIQEGRVHYQWKQQTYTPTNPDQIPRPYFLSNYCAYLHSDLFYDKYHKNIIYVHDKYYNYVQNIDIPQRTTSELDAEDHHWIKWIIIHPSNLLETHGKAILIASYY